VQAVIAAIALIILPLLPRAAALRRTKGKLPTLLYFIFIGIGFMLIEMGFMQKLILYLAHPIYSAAVVIAAFLLFAGVGSRLSALWAAESRRAAPVAAGFVAAFAIGYLLGLDGLLAHLHAQSVAARCGIAALIIAPLALAMGHLLPLALRRVSRNAAPLVPWAWAVNGCASVTATLAAPLIAMAIGFSRLILIAAAFYAAAGLISLRLPRKLTCETDLTPPRSSPR